MHAINILPTPLLSHIKHQTHQMSLYQEIISNADYRNFYKQQVLDGKFVIMDNGAAEGTNPSLAELLVAYEDIKPTEVILPDVVGDKDITLWKTREAYQHLLEDTSNQIKYLMAVPQGHNWEEWIECLNIMMNQSYITTIGISKFVSQYLVHDLGENTNIRQECVAAVVDLKERLNRPDIKIHLLGCYYTPFELQEIERTFPGEVRSTDSAIAYVYTRNDMRITEDQRPDQLEIDFTNGTTENLELLQDNMNMYVELSK